MGLILKQERGPSPKS